MPPHRRLWTPWRSKLSTCWCWTGFCRASDVVSSFGFIEHFTNWREVLAKHAEPVADDGHLIIEAPNFTGAFQRWLHVNFDKANSARHRKSWSPFCGVIARKRSNV